MPTIRLSATLVAFASAAFVILGPLSVGSAFAQSKGSNGAPASGYLASRSNVRPTWRAPTPALEASRLKMTAKSTTPLRQQIKHDEARLEAVRKQAAGRTTTSTAGPNGTAATPKAPTISPTAAKRGPWFRATKRSFSKP